MVDISVWPYELLKPQSCIVYPTPFTRSGGRTLGGTKPSYRTDLGPWNINLENIILSTTEQKRAWNAICAYLGGTSGRIAIPAWAIDTAPYASGLVESGSLIKHSDDTLFSDGAYYSQGPIDIISVGTTAVGATEISMQIINGYADLSGVLFSYNHALYKTGQVTNISGDIWTVRITPTVRDLIPNGADLEFHRPTCLCNLVSDTGMKRGPNPDRVEKLTVSFIEDTKFWSDYVLGNIS